MVNAEPTMGSRATLAMDLWGVSGEYVNCGAKQQGRIVEQKCECGVLVSLVRLPQVVVRSR